MKNYQKDFINFVITAANPKSIDILENVINMQERMMEASSVHHDEYQELWNSFMDVKKDDQWLPILKDGVEIKFMSQEGKEKFSEEISQKEIDFELTATDKTVLNHCIGVLLPVLSERIPEWDRPSETLFNFRKEIVELYKTL